MSETKMIFKRFSNFLQLVLLVVLCGSTVRAAGEYDPTFQAGVTASQVRYTYAVARQPDGKVLVGGNFEVANGYLGNLLVRVNADGIGDRAFNPPVMTGEVRAISVLADGKILIGGNFRIIGTNNYLLLARLNANGTLDGSFAAATTADSSTQNSNTVEDIAVATDGKISIGGSFTLAAPNNGRTKIARFNADGSVDQTFNPTGTFITTRDVEVQPDGKVIAAIAFSSGSGGIFIKRFNQNGSDDASFNAVVNSSATGTGFVSALKLLPDGKLLIGGDFGFVNNTPRVDAARLNTDGTLDTSFNITNDTFASINDIDVDQSGRILLGGQFAQINGTPRNKIARTDANGNLDNTFVSDLLPTLTEIVNIIIPLPDNRVIIKIGSPPGYGSTDVVTRLNTNGSRDNSFKIIASVRGIVTDIAVQADGKLLIGGIFRAVNSSDRPQLARLNFDGSVDTAFNPVVPLESVATVAVQTDGKILVGGYGFEQQPVRRLNADGSPDATFAVSYTQVDTATVTYVDALPDGKILVAGRRGNQVRFFDRLNANGSIDAFFNTTVNSDVFDSILQPDGKILIAGTFSTVNGTPRGGIARLNADGTLDTTFNPLGGASGTVIDMDLQPDGKIMIGGLFTSFNGYAQKNLARVNADGTRDTSFMTETDQAVRAIKVEPSGKILVGGDFVSVSGSAHNRIVRLNSNGTIDSTFNEGTGILGGLNALVRQANGRIVLGGSFLLYNEIPNVSLVRIFSDTMPRPAFDFDGDGKTDLSVFRPSNGVWYRLNSQNNSIFGIQFGTAGDHLAPADYDGDGKTDIAVYRGEARFFYIINSANNTFRAEYFGQNGDLPMSGDWDGDNRADLAVYRPAYAPSQAGFFYYRPTTQPNVSYVTIGNGILGSKPLYGDFDGDGRLDAAVFRASSRQWIIVRSSDNQSSYITFGLSEDIPVPADYDGDGKTDIAVFRPSTGTWYTSTNPANNYGAVQFGASGDVPVPADYDADGKADIAVWRPSNGVWYLNRSTQGLTGIQFGAAEDLPVPNAFVR